MINASNDSELQLYIDAPEEETAPGGSTGGTDSGAAPTEDPILATDADGDPGSDDTTQGDQAPQNGNTAESGQQENGNWQNTNDAGQRTGTPELSASQKTPSGAAQTAGYKLGLKKMFAALTSTTGVILVLVIIGFIFNQYQKK